MKMLDGLVFENAQSAKDFALRLRDVVNLYGLDGIDIDDEYSQCQNSYVNSLVTVVSEFKKLMPNKIISKALFSDSNYFDARYEGKRLGEVLDHGWEMSYWNASCSRIDAYKNRGMSTDKLGIGVSTTSTALSTAQELLQCTQNQNLSFMVFNVNRNSLTFLNSLWGDVHASEECFNNN